MNPAGARQPRAVAALLATMRRTIARRGLLKGGESVVAAVSGGPDSLAMLHALHRLADEYGLELHVAHLDHRLREGSAADAAFVSRQAARLGLPATVRAAEAPQRPRGTSPEEAAREMRLGFLEETAAAVGADRIATGHTLDDQAETVLMRVLTGAGPRGLAGIPAARGPYVRPLLDVRRAQTEAFCRVLRLRPRLDPTNEQADYLRNVIRRETIPALSSTINARLPETLARLADVMAAEDEVMEAGLGEAGDPEGVEGALGLSVELLGALPVALQRRAIRRLAARAGASLSHELTESVRLLALEGSTGQRIALPGPLNARRGYGFLLIGRAPSPQAPATVELLVPGETDLPPWGLRARSWMSSDRPEGWPDGRRICVLDADRIAFPLRVRRVRPGDRFRPIGMTRQKKVGDFFTDQKVPVEGRGEVPLVVGADGEIVWLVGYRPDDRAKIRPDTRRVLWLAMEEA
ncbi:MAG TPA: tRNA lysidine(34) synthetase TilS [Actinomycetota bacterium]